MSDEFPIDPTLAAIVARTSWGQYDATLTLPDGQEHAYSGAELTRIRASVLEDARSYLAAKVGHPGRLEVTDPDGTWLLGIPHDGGELVAIASAPATAAPSTASEAVVATTAPMPARPVLLPSRPTVPTRRRRPRARLHGHGTLSVGDRRLALLGLLAAVILAVVLVQALHHHDAAATAPRHTRTSTHHAAAPASKQPTTASSPRRRPRPAHRASPAKGKPAARTLNRSTRAPKKHRTTHPARQRPATHRHRSTAATNSPAPSSTPSVPVATPTEPTTAPATVAPTHTTKTAPLPSPSGPPPL